MAKLELNILGCGSATPTLRHQPSAQVLNVRDNLMMIDCGEGSQLMMRRMKLKFSRLSNIFVSHLHGDHCFGIPGLISTLALHEKTGSVTIHTFADGADWLDRTIRQFCHELPFEVRFNVIKTGSHLIYEDNAITVTTIPLRHRVPTVGFLFAEKPKLRHINPEMVVSHHIPQWAMNSLRAGQDFITPDGNVIPNSLLTLDPEPCVSYAYCSDTTFSRRVITAVTGVDWLYHEATYDNELRTKARKRFHSTAGEAATVAREADVKRLILGHFSKRYLSEDLLLQQARDVFPDTILADEGLTLDLNAL
ncbi:MAG: ribonuclease Z [Muribaculaceae bacterium]|nr:ribonuclease Z [Muribaculaceae bacterium]